MQFVKTPRQNSLLLVAVLSTVMFFSYGCATSEHYAVRVTRKSSGSERMHVGVVDAQELLKLVFSEVDRLRFTVHREPPWIYGAYPAKPEIIDQFCAVNEHSLLSENVFIVVRLSPEDGAVVVEFRNAFESETWSARRLREAVTRSLSETSIYEVQASRNRVRHVFAP